MPAGVLARTLMIDQLPDLIERKPEHLCFFDEREPINDRGVINAITARRGRSSNPLFS
jgi:hypothetical protein